MKEYGNPFYDWKSNTNRSSFGRLLPDVGNRYKETMHATLWYLCLFLVGIGEKNQRYIINDSIVEVNVSVSVRR